MNADYARHVFYSYQKNRLGPLMYEIWERAFDVLVDDLYISEFRNDNDETK